MKTCPTPKAAFRVIASMDVTAKLTLPTCRAATTDQPAASLNVCQDHATCKVRVLSGSCAGSSCMAPTCMSESAQCRPAMSGMQGTATPTAAYRGLNSSASGAHRIGNVGQQAGGLVGEDRDDGAADPRDVDRCHAVVGWHVYDLCPAICRFQCQRFWCCMRLGALGMRGRCRGAGAGLNTCSLLPARSWERDRACCEQAMAAKTSRSVRHESGGLQ